MLVNKIHQLLAYLALLCIWDIVNAQNLSLSTCATNCITQTTQCQEIQCFCTDTTAYDHAFDCWMANCTVRMALAAQNMTALACHFPDRNIGTIGTAITFTSMSIALVFIAVHILAFIRGRPWGGDDICLGISGILMVANAMLNIYERKSGFGRDVWRNPINGTTEMYFIGGVIYVASIAITKMAFLFFYIRLFPTRNFHKIAYPLLVLIAVQGTLFACLFVVQCSPISYAWTSWDGETQGKCLNFDIGAVIHAMTNIILGFIIFLLPVFHLRKLHVSKKKRWQVSLMFAVGFFVTLISIIRLKSLIAINHS